MIRADNILCFSQDFLSFIIIGVTELPINVSNNPFGVGNTDNGMFIYCTCLVTKISITFFQVMGGFAQLLKYTSDIQDKNNGSNIDEVPECVDFSSLVRLLV